MAKDNEMPAQEPEVAPQVNEEVVESNSTFDEIVKSLKKKCGSPRKCIVKNVNFEDMETYRRVSFTLRNAIPGYRQNANGDWVKENTNVVFSSAYAIAGLLKEKDELAWLGNVILANPNSMNLLFSAAELTIIQQEVASGEEYTNPFSTNADPTTHDYDWIVNHVVDIKLSKVGEKVYEKLMDNILSF